MANRKLSPKMIGEGLAGAAAIAVTILSSPLTARWYRQWGATAAEVQHSLPGDEVVPRPRSTMTLGITIAAPAAQVWPWVMQIGCQRAGWYSYDLLDNGGVPSAEHLMDSFQKLEIGDEVPFTADGKMGFPVVAVEPESALVLGGTTNTKTGEPADPQDSDLETYLSGAIIFYVYERDENSTRLLYRMPLGWNPSGFNTFMYRLMLEPLSFVMARKTLLGIKQRVEAVAARKIAASPI